MIFNSDTPLCHAIKVSRTGSNVADFPEAMGTYYLNITDEISDRPVWEKYNLSNPNPLHQHHILYHWKNSWVVSMRHNVKNKAKSCLNHLNQYLSIQIYNKTNCRSESINMGQLDFTT